MRAIRKHAPEQGAVRTVDVDRPTPDCDEVLVSVTAAGVCGTDAHIYDWDGYEWVDTPVTLGHEFAGVVRSVGDDVDRFEPGDEVIAVPIRGCGDCFQCREVGEFVCDQFVATGIHEDGGFADFGTIPADALVSVPADLSLEAAALTEPAAVATRAVVERGAVTVDDHVVVAGVGPIGVLTAYAARASGAASVTLLGTDADEPVRFPRLADLSFDTVNVQRSDANDAVEARLGSRTPDVVLDATGSPRGLGQALDLVRPGGRIVVVGTPSAPASVDVSAVVRSEVDVFGSYSASLPDFRRATAIVRDHVDVDRLTTTYDVADPTDAFADMLENRAIKPIFSFE